MADSKVTALASATPIATDNLYLIDDPGGTALSRKCTVQGVLDLVGTDAIYIPMTMEVPQGTGAYPDIHPLDTTFAGKVSGFILPTDVDGTINIKATSPIPATLPTSPVYTIRVTMIPTSAQTSTTVHLEYMYANVADGESLDATKIDDIADQAPTISATIETVDVLDITLVTAPVAGDYHIGQLVRDISEDTYAGSILIINCTLIITAA
jgi:hypothetical protein